MHPLDNPIWEALRTRQAKWAEANPFACRFPPAMTSLGGMAAPSAEGFAGLAALQAPGQATGLFFTEVIDPPPGWKTVARLRLPQMLHESALPALPSFEPIELCAADSPEMEALAALTKPGPFGPETYKLGTYLGVRHNGRLVAMAGERVQPPGFTEISAVCTHPEATGQGLAGGLVAILVDRIRTRGEVPFLHVVEENTRAIALYERLGFRRRRCLEVLVAGSPR